MKERKWNLKARMITGFIILIAVVYLIISALFLHTSMTMREDYRNLVCNNVEHVVSDLDTMVREIYFISDTFAAASVNQLDYYMEKEYGQGDELAKKADTLRLYNEIFASYDVLQEKKKLGAIYTDHDVLFNFMDIGWDGPEVIDRLEEMNINKIDKPVRFCWYSLQDNFLVSEPYNEVRRDKVVIGARRVFSVWKSEYICTHIFCIEEKEFYGYYRESVAETKGDIYILDSKGELVSSSDMATVASGTVDSELKDLVLNRRTDDFTWQRGQQENLVCVRQSELGQFLTIAVIPKERITGDVDALYRRIFLVLLVCILICCAMFLYLYRSFISPINELNSAMKQVYDDNMGEYIPEAGRNEIGDMMCYHNAMLRSMNALELKVLMSQINPHFLYNTLETIVWKSNEAGHPDIGRLAAALGRMYRLSISGGQVIIPMQQEIDHLTAYIKIQKNRYGEQFLFELQTKPELVQRLYCLKILLQPVVENSFRYGMDGLERQLVIRMKIKVRGANMEKKQLIGKEQLMGNEQFMGNEQYMGNEQSMEEGQYVEILVLDNGTGMSREQLYMVRQQIKSGRSTQEPRGKSYGSTGIGLHNAAARISLYCGIKDPIRIYSWEGLGTIIRIRLPLLLEADMGRSRGKPDRQTGKKE